MTDVVEVNNDAAINANGLVSDGIVIVILRGVFYRS